MSKVFTTGHDASLLTIFKLLTNDGQEMDHETPLYFLDLNISKEFGDNMNFKNYGRRKLELFFLMYYRIIIFSSIINTSS